MPTQFVEISPSYSPADSHRIDFIGKVQKVVINGGGGMGGSRVVHYGKLEKPKGNIPAHREGMLRLRLSQSGREIWVNPQYIGTTEEVKLWSSTTTGKHGVAPDGSIVVYFWTYNDVSCRAGRFNNHNTPDRDPNCAVIDKKDC